MKKINFKTYFSKRKQRLAISGVSPKFDWLLILGIGLVLFIVGAGYSVFLYIQLNNGSLFEVVEETNIEIELENKKKTIEEQVKMIEGQKMMQEEVFDELNAN